MADRYLCVGCKKVVTGTKNDRYRSHSDGDGEPCEMSSVAIPEHVLAEPYAKGEDESVPVAGLDFATCPQCERKVKLTRLGYFEPHGTTLRGGDRCEVSGVRAKHARKTETVPLPGDEPLPPSAAVPEERDSARPGVLVAAEARKPLELTAGPSSPEPTTTSEGSSSPGESSPGTSSDASEEEPAAAGPFQLAPNIDDRILQPFSHIFQPFPVPPKVKLAEAMSDEGKELAARFREIFYAYTNRNAKDNRSAQKRMGPSEIGSPCDRQIAMKLLGVRPTNPQEGWAPFVGTAVHVELAKMFEWANGPGSGRFITEMPVELGSDLVPRGTLDVYDGVLWMVDDHKLMGRYSLDKLIQQGPSETYRIQLQTYGLGAERAGFKVKKVALIAWPRQESSLDKLYVHVEPYDRKIAEAAIRRVESIAESVGIRKSDERAPNDMTIAQEFSPGDDCKWCPFHLKGDKGFTRGCPGK